MANTTVYLPQLETMWGDTKQKFLLNSGAATYYTGAMVGQDPADAYITKLDDTASLIFVGLIATGQPVTINSTDSAGAYKLDIDRPQFFSMAIASAAAGDEGRKVYALYDGTVQYAPTTYCNLVGRVIRVINSTTVVIAPPWSPFFTASDSCPGVITFTTATYTLTKNDVNKLVLGNSVSNMTLTLPAVALTSPGDSFEVVNIIGTQTLTLAGNAAELINGSNTLAVGTTQYTSKVKVRSTGSKWIVVNT